MTRAVAIIALSAMLAGCAADPPSAVVGIEAGGCEPTPALGSGLFVELDGSDEPLVLTSAHVVAGAEQITIRRGDATGSGTIVAFDPEMDLAYLAVDGLDTSRPWRIDGSAVERDERGVTYVVRDGEPVVLPITIVRRIQIRTEDIYLEGETLRPGYELAAAIEEGDSGGAVVVDGRVVGVVWARSRRDSNRAYAIDPVRAGALVEQQITSADLGDVDLTRCS